MKQALALFVLAFVAIAPFRVLASEVTVADGSVRLRTSDAEFEVTASSALKASLVTPGGLLSLDRSGPAPALDRVTLAGRRVADFESDLAAGPVGEARGKLGAGKRVEVTGRSAVGLERTLSLEVYDEFPRLLVVSASYKNVSAGPLRIERVDLLRRSLAGAGWSFQGASEAWGQDDVVRLAPGLERQNLVGSMLKGGYGSGLPIVAFWSATVGEAIGHLETVPFALSIPVSVGKDGSVTAALSLSPARTLAPGEVFATPRAFLSVYAGDFFEPVQMYSAALQREGWALPKPSRAAYDAAWCGWGYESDVTPAQMLGIIPKLKELGIRWATLDDRWFDDYGDWEPRADTFPGRAIPEMVDEYHRQGLLAQIWWLPLGVEDGRGKYESHPYRTARVVTEHPDWLILGKDGKPARIVRGLAALCPALPEVQEFEKGVTLKFVRDWGFDGHKLDNIYAMPPCYNPKHKHRRPEESTEAMGEVYKTIFETTRALKPESVTQICPCGTTPSLDWVRHMDQAVTADPVGSVQVRRRLKLYKALLGADAAVFGDHVELTVVTQGPDGKESDRGSDFASTVGLGGVVGTKFVWPETGERYKDVRLTPEKEAHWKKWFGIYNERRLSEGTFLDLYNYGYDVPEAYAVSKAGRMHYAFFAPQGGAWKGEVELRGLEPGRYRIRDYVANRDLGAVDAGHPRLAVEIQDSLLVVAEPEAVTAAAPR